MTIISARYGNEEETAIIVETDDLGAVAVSEQDAGSGGGVWEALQTWVTEGGQIAPYKVD